MIPSLWHEQLVAGAASAVLSLALFVCDPGLVLQIRHCSLSFEDLTDAEKKQTLCIPLVSSPLLLLLRRPITKPKEEALVDTPCDRRRRALADDAEGDAGEESVETVLLERWKEGL